MRVDKRATNIVMSPWCGVGLAVVTGSEGLEVPQNRAKSCSKKFHAPFMSHV
jgi:hypothetical protein